VSNDAYNPQPQPSHYSFGSWLAPRAAMMGLATGLMAGIIGLGQLFIR
jgi:hypothetical protein